MLVLACSLQSALPGIPSQYPVNASTLENPVLSWEVSGRHWPHNLATCGNIAFSGLDLMRSQLQKVPPVLVEVTHVVPQ